MQENWETLQLGFAVLLAAAVAFMSTGADARRTVSVYLSAALAPSLADFGTILPDKAVSQPP